MAVSADGRTIVGGAYDLGNSAWMWRPQTGVQPIEVSVGGDDAMFTALDVSDNGKIVVGFGRKGPRTRAFIWIHGKGGIFLDRYLANTA